MQSPRDFYRIRRPHETALVLSGFCRLSGEAKLGTIMQADIHPKYHDVKAICSCGNTFTTRSTFAGEEIKLDVCSKCHPFYTGKQNIVDTEGRVDGFNKKFANFGAMRKRKTEN